MKISFGFCIFLVLALLLLPIRWCIGALLAAVIHESFHVFAVMLSGGKIRNVSASGLGARIYVTIPDEKKRALCALAGPVGSFLCLLAAEHYPELALCGIVQGAYNLLPIYPLDGGSILRCICPAQVYVGVEWFALIFMTGFALWLTVYDFGLMVPVLISVWYPVFQRKISCKEANLAVQ